MTTALSGSGLRTSDSSVVAGDAGTKTGQGRPSSCMRPALCFLKPGWCSLYGFSLVPISIKMNPVPSWIVSARSMPLRAEEWTAHWLRNDQRCGSDRTASVKTLPRIDWYNNYIISLSTYLLGCLTFNITTYRLILTTSLWPPPMESTCWNWICLT